MIERFTYREVGVHNALCWADADGDGQRSNTVTVVSADHDCEHRLRLEPAVLVGLEERLDLALPHVPAAAAAAS